MTLKNLLDTGQLKDHEPDPQEIQRLLAAARRNLQDARVTDISTETRFDAAYKALIQIALVALAANGYRPDTKRPGHHLTVLQSLAKTMDAPGEQVAVLDVLRRKRNASDYTGEAIDPVSLETCITQAEALLEAVEPWLRERHPHLVS